MTATVFDASFISQGYRLSNDCLVLEFLRDYITSGCVAFECQYLAAPCNLIKCCCEFIDDAVSDEQAILFFHNCPEGVYLERIYDANANNGDFIDLKIATYAHTNNSVVFSCDRRLLLICKQLKIAHSCFKKAIYDCHLACDNELFPLFDTEFMFSDSESNPFLNYHINSRCSECSETPCEFPSLPDSGPPIRI